MKRLLVGSGFIGLLLALPLFGIVVPAVSASGSQFAELWLSVLPVYIVNSVILVAATLLLSLLWGIPAAWLMTQYRFPGQRILRWALCLSLALPSYLIAFLYTDLLDVTGPIQRGLRQLFNLSGHGSLFPIRSLGGAALVLSLIFFPYVYLMVRTSLLELSPNMAQAAQLLGASPVRRFWRITLPLTRPAIVVALMLVAMETLGDFGAVSYFAVPTLTTAVYDTWLSYGNLGSAAQIACIMLFCITLLFSLERTARRHRRVWQQNAGQDNPIPPRLLGWRALAAQGYCWGLVACASGIPLLRLLFWVITYFDVAWTHQFWRYGLNSLLASSAATLISLATGLFLLGVYRFNGQKSALFSLRAAQFGYAIPGTVLAVGLLVPLSGADRLINALTRSLGWGNVGLVLSGSLIALVLAYVIRFSAMMVGSLESSLHKINPSLDMAGQTLGCRPLHILRRIHLPLMRKGILTGALLVFVECMKELNATLLLRPFNFDTLVTYVFTFTSDEQIELAALPALLLVLIGLWPVIYLIRALERSNERP